MSRSTRAATAAERAVVTYLQAMSSRTPSGHPGGANDRGDVLRMPGVVEVKAQRAVNVAAALAEPQVEAANAGVRRGLAVLKRRRRPVGEWYALTPLWLAAELLEEDGR